MVYRNTTGQAAQAQHLTTRKRAARNSIRQACVMDALERRVLMSADPALVRVGKTVVPFMSGELQNLGVEQVRINGKNGLAYDGQFLLRLKRLQMKSGTAVEAAQEAVDRSKRVSRFEKQFGADVKVIRQVGSDGTFLVEVPKVASYKTVSKALNNLSGLQYVEPNAMVWAQDRTPNDPQYNNSGQWGLRKVSAPAAWDSTTGGNSDLVAAVLDSGIDYTHPDLVGNMWQNPGETANDGIDNDANGYIDDRFGYNFVGANSSNPYDDSATGHGTHSAGIIGAVGNNSVGVAGTNWNIDLMAVKVLDSGGVGSLADAVEGFNYLTNLIGHGINVKVASASWGTLTDNTSLKNAITAYTTAGGMLVAAAGNNANSTKFYPAAYSGDANSALANGVIAVANSTQTDDKASDSNFGSWVNIAAPGTGIYSTLPGGQYGQRSGTSQSAPLVAGAVALLWDAAGLATARSTIRNAILTNVDTLPSSWTSTPLANGAGRLNVASAISSLALPWNVTSTTPAVGSTLTSAATQFTVNFSSTYRASSVQAADFAVNNISATSVTQVDADTLRFNFTTTPMTASGTQTMSIGAGAILRSSDGSGIAAFNGTFKFDALPLAPTASSPASGTTVALPMLQLDVTYNEALDPASIDPGDLILSLGEATSAVLISPNTVRFTLTGVNDETASTLSAQINAGAVKDIYGFNGAAFVASYPLSATGDAPIPTLSPVAPSGSMIYRSTAIAGTINPATDTDGFTVNLNAGQQLTITIDPATTLHPSIDLYDPLGTLIAQAIPDNVGQSALIQSLPLTVDGIYRIVVSAVGSTTGTYTVTAQINASDEEENHNLPGNDIAGSAQSLDDAFFPLTPSTARAAALGTLAAVNTSVERTMLSESFESTLNASWTLTSSNGNGRIQLSPTYAGYLSQTALLMDRAGSSGSFVRNEAIWDVDLASLTNATLTFGTVNLGDERHGMPAAFNGSSNSDGVAISADGVNWHRVYTPPVNEVYGQWQYATIDLDDAAQAAGLAPGSITKIKFQQYDNAPLGTDGRGYDAISITASAPPEDWYSFTAAAGSTYSIALDTDSQASIALELYRPDGSLLASAPTSGGTMDRVLENYLLSDTGTYRVRVVGSANTATPYRVLVTRNAAMDIEPNDTAGIGQELPASGIASGGITTADAGDFYRFKVNAGDDLTISTATPAGIILSGVNALDPALELYDESGNLVASDQFGAPDTINASLTHTASTSGIYTVRVVGESGEGDYILSLTGNTGGPLVFAITNVTPASDANLRVPVSEIAVDFGQSIDGASVQPGDLTVNGVQAVSVTQSDRNTLVFTPAAPFQAGSYTIAVAGASIRSAQGAPVAAFTSNFKIDLTPPVVTTSSITNNAFYPIGSLTYTATFDDDLVAGNLDASDFALRGLGLTTNYAVDSFTYTPGTRTLVLEYSNLPEDAYTLTLRSGDGAVENVAGWDLDGDTDQAEGGDFIRTFALELASSPFPTPLVAARPGASLAFSGSTSSKIDFGTDTDELTINLDAGQVLSLQMSGAGTLQPALTLKSTTGTVLGTASGPAGGTTLLQNISIPTAGVYTIVASSAGNSTGNYSITARLNSAIESESFTGSSNNTQANAQGIDASTLNLVNSVNANRMAVTGTLEAGASDWYSFPLSATNQVSIGVSGESASQLVIDLVRPNGTVVTTGAATSTSVDSIISNVRPNAAGTYAVRVYSPTLNTPVNYTLVVARNSQLDAEANDSTATAADIGVWGTATGAITAGDTDHYRFLANSGSPITLITSTPGDGAGEFVNTLSPTIDLYDPSGNIVATNTGGAPDGRNARISYTAASGGVYVARVRDASGTGAYTLAVTGSADGLLPLTVTQTSPANNSFIRVTPSFIDVDFSAALDQSTLQAGDLTLNNIAATGVTIRGVDASKWRFTFPANAVKDGTLAAGGITENSVNFADASIANTDGTQLTAYNGIFNLDLTPPTVASASISNGQFFAIGNLTYTATFNEPLLASGLDATDITLRGNNLSQNYSPASFSYDVATRTLSASYTGLPEDAYTLTLLSGDGKLENRSGWNLDGDNNATEGGNYVANFGLEVASANFATPLTAVAPAGSQVYSGSQSSKIDFAGDTDSWTLDLDAGQSLSVVMTGNGTLQPRVTVLAPNGTTLGTATGAAAGKALVQAMPVATAGVYTIVASGNNNSTGTYALNLLLNSAFEAENQAGATNDSTATAQDLTSAFVTLPGGALQASVSGRVSANASDRFAFISDSFETGTLSSAWSTSTNGVFGRTRVLNTYPAADGTRLLAMDVSTANGTFVRNDATWQVNLTGLTSPRLKFNYANLGDELHALTQTFTGSANGDGVAISFNNVNWYRVYQAPTTTFNAWQTVDIDITAAALAAGFTVGNTLYAKFIQYDNLPLSTSAGDGIGYDNVQITVVGTSDHYKFNGNAGETLALALNGAGNGAYDIRIFNPSGTLIAQAASVTGGDMDSALASLTLPTTGTYTVRVAASLSTPEDYTLVLTRNAAFNIEPATAGQALLAGSAVGSVGIGADTDLFTFNLAASQQISLSTFTPGDGNGLFVNTLDPILEILDSNNNVLASNNNDPAGDGRNARVTFVAPTAGAFKVRVSAASGQGEYVLTSTTSATSSQTPGGRKSGTRPATATGSTLASTPPPLVGTITERSGMSELFSQSPIEF